MPGRDGTGPFGAGASTGRCFGSCAGVNAGRYNHRFAAGYGRGLGLGSGYGCGKGRFFGLIPSESTDKELLTAERDLLKARLSSIDKHLDSMKKYGE